MAQTFLYAGDVLTYFFVLASCNFWLGEKCDIKKKFKLIYFTLTWNIITREYIRFLLLTRNADTKDLFYKIFSGRVEEGYSMEKKKEGRSRLFEVELAYCYCIWHIELVDRFVKFDDDNQKG